MRQDAHLSSNKVVSIFRTIEELNLLKDVDTILDKTLYEARKLANADAGSIFLKEKETLRFSYVQNDTLFPKDEANVALYADFRLPISARSIVGYAALTGETVIIDDAYDLDDALPYRFNPAYDRKSGYKTVSVLAIPLGSFSERLVGVMQLINARDEQGNPAPFSKESQDYMPLFANHASLAIERGIMNRELILRMMKMAELRDPHETGAHVQRVGAYSAELYQQWALVHGVDRNTIRRTRDVIRLSSMLHDVGKVGISDVILKKPGKLDETEFQTMRWHTVFGARLFLQNTSSLDEMSYDIALNHHEKWDGTGYPGHISDIGAEGIPMSAPKKGEEISIYARITALADVFDALSSRRSYKEPWTDEKILEIIEQDVGTHFDPSVVETFFQIFDVIKAIREKYRD